MGSVASINVHEFRLQLLQPGFALLAFREIANEFR